MSIPLNLVMLGMHALRNSKGMTIAAYAINGSVTHDRYDIAEPLTLMP
jgi:hypothetical protein